MSFRVSNLISSLVSSPSLSLNLRRRTSRRRSCMLLSSMSPSLLGRVAGPSTCPPLPNLHVSSFGVIPKRGQPGKWHLIIDLSSLGGSSINDGIDSQDFTLQYIKLDEVIRMVSCYGPGALMAKCDVEAVYWNIPTHPDDPFLLGMKWREQYYIDLAFSFGLRSALFIFNSVADKVEWILLNQHHVSDLLHYCCITITVSN